LTTIIGVHGVGNHLPELDPAAAVAHLSSVWSIALGRNVDVAYYAHHLRTEVAQSLEEDPDSLGEEERRLLLDWDEALRGHRLEPQGWLTIPPRQLLGAMASGRFSSLPMQLFALLLLREVQWYLGKRHQDRRTAARDTVAEAIRSSGASVVLAHSLGSVVTYEALWAHNLEIDLLVTMGSPLAIRGLVFDRLTPSPARGVRAPRPPGARRWVNISDPGDMCAVPRWLGKSFDVDDDLEAQIGVFDFHRVSKYLACEQMRSILG
jgi:hypothetical protein